MSPITQTQLPESDYTNARVLQAIKDADEEGTISSLQNGSDRIRIEGFFPAGTNLEISTGKGTRQFIATEQPLIERSVSAGTRTFQFNGGSEQLSALLKRREEAK